MQRGGINLATVGVFSWARLEPRPGEYDFAWLDDVLDTPARGRDPRRPRHGHRLAAAVARAAASRDPAGDRGGRAPRGRQSAAVLPELARLPRTRAGARHPAGGAVRGASGPRAVAREQRVRMPRQPLLLRRVGRGVPRRGSRRSTASIDELNRAWGTAFWSQRYDAFDEVEPPRAAPTFRNPTQLLDFDRFSSDELLACYRSEVEVIRAGSDVPITTNFMGFFKPVDYWKWAREVDVVSDDTYPDPADPLSPAYAAMVRDLMRSLGGGAPWLLMEQSPSAVNWRAQNAAKAPGQMRAWSYQSVARGADGILFFQWRQSAAGSEKFHSGMVPHGGTDTRVWREIEQLGGELQSLSAGTGDDAVEGTRVRVSRRDRPGLGQLVGDRAAGVADDGLVPRGAVRMASGVHLARRSSSTSCVPTATCRPTASSWRRPSSSRPTPSSRTSSPSQSPRACCSCGFGTGDHRRGPARAPRRLPRRAAAAGPRRVDRGVRPAGGARPARDRRRGTASRRAQGRSARQGRRRRRMGGVRARRRRHDAGARSPRVRSPAGRP